MPTSLDVVESGPVLKAGFPPHPICYYCVALSKSPGWTRWGGLSIEIPPVHSFLYGLSMTELGRVYRAWTPSRISSVGVILVVFQNSPCSGGLASVICGV
ncbi:hypothetical protein BaRGS_00006891 [Batillaria attramentaria]|uniref:Uncharacterized protein n=1 Tax=Batillaria attramentaria TaxID=370345 RepID=A0ABD0LQM2_9CAEN